MGGALGGLNSEGSLPARLMGPKSLPGSVTHPRVAESAPQCVYRTSKALKERGSLFVEAQLVLLMVETHSFVYNYL